MVRPTLLVLRALGLGDFLSAVPVYRALARHFPQHRRVLAAPAPLHACVLLLSGAFHDVLDAKPLANLPATLGDVDVAVNLHGRGPQSHRTLLALEPCRLLAFAHQDVSESRSGARWIAGEHEVERWCRMLGHYGIAANAAEIEVARPAIVVPSRFRGATLLHPGAASAARRWPLERWISVARACAQRGDRLVFTGTAEERVLTSEIVRRAGVSTTRNLAGRTSLVELCALVAAASKVVCADTGIAHLATAYRTPSVVLFGPTPPSEWGPPLRPWHRVLWTGKAGNPHADVVDAGLLSITSAAVLGELERLPARPESAHTATS